MKLNRTQALVLGFVLLAWVSLLPILAVAPETYDAVLHLPAGSRAAELGFLLALGAFLALLGTGIVRRWRWTFWLVLVAFLAGVLRVPAGGPPDAWSPRQLWPELVCPVPGIARSCVVRDWARYARRLPPRRRLGSLLMPHDARSGPIRTA